MPKLTPSQPDREIICFIGGAFRPPNHRHWQMISYFSDLVGDKGEVIVVVSNPKAEKSQHRMAYNDRPITTEEAVQVLEIFRDSENRSNVTILESEEASPVRTIYGMAKDPEICGDKDVLIGCYKDEADFKKWDRLEEQMKESNPTATLLDYRRFALRRSYENFAHGISDLQRRSGGIRLADEREALPKFLSDDEVKEVLDIVYHGEQLTRETENEEDKDKKPEENSEGQISESASDEEVVEYDSYGEFVSDWGGFDPDLNIPKESKFTEDGKFEIKFEQPQKHSVFVAIVPNDNHFKDPEDWMSEVSPSKLPEANFVVKNNPSGAIVCKFVDKKDAEEYVEFMKKHEELNLTIEEA